MFPDANVFLTLHHLLNVDREVRAIVLAESAANTLVYVNWVWWVIAVFI
jgi:hypothetical protein